MHSIFTRPQIDGADPQAFHHRTHLLEAKPVGPCRIAVAEGTSQVALVGKPESECKPVGRTRSNQRRACVLVRAALEAIAVGFGGHLHAKVSRDRSSIQSLEETKA